MKTGKEIIQSGIITNYIPENVQQVGVDLRVNEIYQMQPQLHLNIDGYKTCRCAGNIPKEGKTELFFNKKPLFTDQDKCMLEAGYYEVVFEEGCKLNKNTALDLKTRSSLVRCGATIHNGMFDPGFETENIGCFLEVRFPIIVEKGSRLAQAVVYSCSDVDNVYNGQWQHDIQRR